LGRKAKTIEPGIRLSQLAVDNQKGGTIWHLDNLVVNTCQFQTTITFIAKDNHFMEHWNIGISLTSVDNKIV
jgi:hypothetical protein